jgi:hypothetical protein
MSEIDDKNKEAKDEIEQEEKGEDDAKDNGGKG